jgi:hypothetical protein
MEVTDTQKYSLVIKSCARNLLTTDAMTKKISRNKHGMSIKMMRAKNFHLLERASAT